VLIVLALLVTTLAAIITASARLTY